MKTTKAKIYKPAKTAMQSGTRNTRKWLLVFESNDPKFIDPLMGWTGNADTLQQVKLRFDSLEEALDFARRNDIEVDVEEERKRNSRPKAYAENFSFYRIKAAEG